MTKIFRFELRPGVAAVEMPMNSQVIHFGYQEQRREFSIWAECPAYLEEKVTRTFIMLPTSGEVEINYKYIGSCCADGFVMVHCYEILGD